MLTMVDDRDENRCQDCGTDEHVSLVNCPFYEDVWGEIVLVRVCPPCYQSRADDI